MADDLTFEEITGYFTKVGAADACPVCRTANWTIPSLPHDGTVGLFTPRPDGGYLMPGGVIPTIVVACTNCGFIRLHSAAILLDKIRGKPLNPEKGNG